MTTNSAVHHDGEGRQVAGVLRTARTAALLPRPGTSCLIGPAAELDLRVELVSP